MSVFNDLRTIVQQQKEIMKNQEALLAEQKAAGASLLKIIDFLGMNEEIVGVVPVIEKPSPQP